MRREEPGWGKRGIVDAAGILVGQDVCDVGDVVEKFTGRPSRVPGDLPQGIVNVGAGDPIPAAAKIEALTPPGVVATR